MACRRANGSHRTRYLLALLILSGSLVAGCTTWTGLSLIRNPAGAEGEPAVTGSDHLPAAEDDVPLLPAGAESSTEAPSVPARTPRVCPSGAAAGAATGWDALLRPSPMGAEGDAQDGPPDGNGSQNGTADEVPSNAPDGDNPAQPHATPPTGEGAPESVPPGSSDAQPASLEQALRAYLTKLNGTYGVHVIDLTTGETTSVNADQVFVAASTFKVPMAMYVLDLVNQGQTSLDEPLTYQPEDWEDGTGLIQQDLVDGDCYTVTELLDLMLTESDNIATNMLLRRFGQGNAFRYMEQLGGTVTHLDTGRRATTPRDMAQYLAQAYRTAEAGDPLYRTLIDRLMHTAFSDRIAAGVPEGVPVAHKIGTVAGMVHDVGVVLLPDHPFVLAIFSMNVDEAEAAIRLAEITNLVYRFELDGSDLVPAAPVEGQQP